MADVRGRGVASPPFSSPTLADKLRIASSKGQLDKVQLLLEASAGFLPDKENYEDGRLPLHYAAAEGYTEVCRVLINHGADMNSQDSEGNTALHLATKNGYSRTVELLAKSHCNLFICNKWRCTALHLAAESGHNQTARVLLYAGINPDIPNEYGDSALITACRYGHAGVTRILLSANCKVNHQNNHGDTALHISAATHKRKITKLLLEGGINTSISNSANETAAAIAKRKNYPEVLWLIASHPAPPQPAPQHHHHHMKDQLDFHPEGPTVVPEGDLPGKLASTQQPPKKEKKFLFFKKKKSKKEKAAEEVKLQVSSKPRAGHHHRPSVQGLFSQYINKPGYQYYRDLAGNIKQGPVGYAPSCQCKPALKKLEDRLESNRDQLYQHFDASQQVLRERLEQLDQRTTQQVNALDKRTQERFESEQTHCRDRILHYLGQERDQFSQRLDAHGAEVRTELRDWVETRLQDTFREPVNKPQDDSGLYQRDIFTGATPHVEGRLYRTRSDETLSQSDYSVKKKKYHFYESRQAAMQSLRAWKVQGYSRENRADRQPLSLHQSSQNVQRIQNSEARERSRSSYQLAEEHPQRQSANGNRCKSSYDLVANKPVKQVVQADIHKSFDYMDSRTIPHSSSYPTRPAGSQPSVYHASDYAKSSQGGLSQYHGAISKQTEQRDHSMSPERPSVFSRLEPSPIAYCPQRPSVAQTSSAQSTSGQLYPSSSYTPHYTTSLTNRDYQPHAALKPVTEDASKPPSSASGLTMYNNYGKLNLISEDRVSGTQYRPTNTDTSSKQFSVLQPGPVSYNRASERGSTSDSPRSQTHSSHYSGSAGEATPQTSAPNPVYATQQSSVSRVWARPQDYELRGVRPSQPPVPQPKPDLIYMRSAQTYRSDQPNPPGPDRPNPDVVYQVRAAYQTSPQNTQPLYHGLGKDDSGSNPDSGYSSRIYGTRLQSATPSPRNTSSFQLDPNSSSRWTPSSTSSAEHNLSESPVPRASPYSQAQSPPHHYTTSPNHNANQRQEALRHVASHIQSWYQRQQYQYPGEDNSTRLNKPPQAQKYTNNNSQPYSNSGGNGNKESYSSLQGSDV